MKWCLISKTKNMSRVDSVICLWTTAPSFDWWEITWQKIYVCPLCVASRPKVWSSISFSFFCIIGFSLPSTRHIPRHMCVYVYGTSAGTVCSCFQCHWCYFFLKSVLFQHLVISWFLRTVSLLCEVLLLCKLYYVRISDCHKI